jgi:hypothetical protein
MVTPDGYYEICKDCFKGLTVERVEKEQAPIVVTTAQYLPRAESMSFPPDLLKSSSPTPLEPTLRPFRKKRKVKKTYEERLEWSRRHSLGKNYGLTLEGLERLKKAQDYKCSICKKESIENTQYGALIVDYDKTTDTVRGVTCRGCKLGLVNFNTPELLFTAIEYLEKAKK